MEAECWIALWKWLRKPSDSNSLQSYLSDLTIYQPYHKFQVHKFHFHTLFEAGCRISLWKQLRHKGINQTYLMSYYYQQSGNLIRRYEYLSVIFILFLSRVLDFTMKMASETIKWHLVTKILIRLDNLATLSQISRT